MGKNAHLHIVLESEDLLRLKEEALIQGIRLSELCRQKLKTNAQLKNIEQMIQLLTDNLIKNGKYKEQDN